MKIPDVFIPEENLDEQTKNLKNSKEKEKLEGTKTLSDCLMYETWFDHKEYYKEKTKKYSCFDF